jgi:hypothetical protein
MNTTQSSGTEAGRADGVVMFGAGVAYYSIPNKLAEHILQPAHARLSTLRGVGVGPNGFAIESFVDELAKAWGKNPLAFRLELAEGMPRMQALLHTVAQMSDWTRKREDTALGLALQEKAETLAAGVAELLQQPPLIRERTSADVEPLRPATRRDVAILGQGNEVVGTLISPTLTTTDYCGTEIGQRALDVALQRVMKTRQDAPQQAVVPPILIPRETTRLLQ